jgi:hypothetical protein
MKRGYKGQASLGKCHHSRRLAPNRLGHDKVQISKQVKRIKVRKRRRREKKRGSEGVRGEGKGRRREHQLLIILRPATYGGAASTNSFRPLYRAMNMPGTFQLPTCPAACRLPMVKNRPCFCPVWYTGISVSVPSPPPFLPLERRWVLKAFER